MAARQLTSKDVVKYLMQLTPGQKLPTLRELQAALGGGSLDTMSRGIREYMNRTQEQAEQSMPESFTGLGNELSKKYWEAALSEIRTAEEKVREENRAKLEELNRVVEALEKENADLTKKVEGRERQMDKLFEELGAVRIDAAKAKDRVEKLQEDCRAAREEAKAERAGARKLAKELTEEKVKRAAAEAALAAFKEIQETRSE